MNYAGTRDRGRRRVPVRQAAWRLPALVAMGCTAATTVAHAHEPLTIDTHVDIPDDYMRDPRFDVGTRTQLRVDLGKMARGGLDAAFFVVYVEQGPRTAGGYARAVEAAERKFSAIESMLERYPDRIRLARTPAEVRANHDAGLLSAMIGIENGYALGRSLARLDAAHARGARYLGLTHTGHNAICTSSGTRAAFGDVPAGDRGLSDFGRSVVLRANALGMMVDVSHASDACVRDVLAFSVAPVIASHSSARALVDHARNLPDDLLRAIAAKGGVVHAVAYREFVKHDPARAEAEAALQARVAASAGAEEFDSVLHGALPMHVQGMREIEAGHPMATLAEYVDHVVHMVAVAGIDHVGIASDFDGGGQVTGWSDASETANVTAELRKRGFTEAEIGKLWSGNLLRTWRVVEEAAARD